MKIKTIGCLALSVALSSCIFLGACKTENPNNGSLASQNLKAQVLGTKNIYTSLYERSVRNGGLFSSSEQSTLLNKSESAAMQKAFAEEQTVDTSSLISELVNIVKQDAKIGMPNKYALETFVLDVFAYTQIASALIGAEEEKVLAQIYDIEYDIDTDFNEKMKTSSNWVSKIPEEMSIVGYENNKVNAVFKARNPSDKVAKKELFEEVNSEMYYVSDDNFGYAQITTRYNTLGEHTETGFNYFSMKDKEMLELNFSSSGTLTSVYTYESLTGNVISSFSNESRQVIQNHFVELQAAFKNRTALLEQQNLALANEAQIVNVEAKSETIYNKSKAQNPYHVTFNYEILDKMMGKI